MRELLQVPVVGVALKSVSGASYSWHSSLSLYLGTCGCLICHTVLISVPFDTLLPVTQLAGCITALMGALAQLLSFIFLQYFLVPFYLS